MNEIFINIGVYTALEVDLSDFNFDNIEKVVLTIKNSECKEAPIIVEREYTEPKVYPEIVTPEEAARLRSTAVYDFNFVVSDGKRYKTGSTGTIKLVKGVGRVAESHNS